MTFEEFKSNLNDIRAYKKRLSKYAVSWLNDEITKAVIRGEHDIYIPRQRRTDERHKYKRRERDIKKTKLPDSIESFYWKVSGIVGGVIYGNSQEDEEQTPRVLGKAASVATFEDLEGERILYTLSGEQVKLSIKTFKILNYYYFEGYTVKHIAKLFGYGIDPNTQEAENRDGVYYQIDKGTAELFKLYADKYPDEISPSATTRKSESKNNNTQEETHEQHEDRDE